MKKKEKISLFDNIRSFAMINWWVVWIVLIAVGLDNHYSRDKMSEKIEQALALMQKESRGVVMLDKLGRPITAKKTNMDITSEALKMVILNTVQYYFIHDSTSLTNNFDNTIFNVDSLEKFNPKFKEFRENFLGDSKKSKGEFLTFEKYIVYLLSNDKMPEQISILDSRITSYSVDKNIFTIKISFNVVANIFNTNTGKYEQRSGNIVDVFEGKFDSSRSTIINPLGLIFISIKPSLLTKEQ